MSFTAVPGTGDNWGGHNTGPVVYVGPTAYVNGVAGGELTPTVPFNCFNELAFVVGSVSVSGTYRAICQPTNSSGHTTWKVRVIVISSGLEVANGFDLSAESFYLWGFGV